MTGEAELEAKEKAEEATKNGSEANDTARTPRINQEIASCVGLRLPDRILQRKDESEGDQGPCRKSRSSEEPLWQVLPSHQLSRTHQRQRCHNHFRMNKCCICSKFVKLRIPLVIERSYMSHTPIPYELHISSHPNAL